MLSIAGLGVLLLLWLVASHVRWTIARHFGQPWQLMNAWDMMDAWDHMRCSGYCLHWRIIVVAWALLGLALMVMGAING